MLDILQTVINLFVSAMCFTGVYFTCRTGLQAGLSFFVWIKLLILVIAGIMFLVFAIQYLLEYLKIKKKK